MTTVQLFNAVAQSYNHFMHYTVAKQIKVVDTSILQYKTACGRIRTRTDTEKG